ncbi:SMP-30/gluconolactonase/LRE family protein [Actinomadura gamaensis]|uniref:SMP-30/gluconolactonase/LRE family protein n=1 Tax=Actinomadura gamaensis TaxID=1763541 RepID=A0ABV9TZ15_9ACTN
MTPEIALRAAALLGEGPTWDPAAGRLLWVDILRSEIHRYDPSGGRDEVLDVPQHVGAAKPCRGGGLVLNLRDGVALRSPAGDLTWLSRFPDDPDVRGNDATVGPDGAFWAGTMRYDEAAGGGALRRVTPDGATTTVFPDVTVSNGLAWSPDRTLAYYVDSPTGRVDVFPAEAPERRAPFVRIPPPGFPDGLTVDADGCVWVAMWSGGRVHRFTPDARLDRTIELPAAQTTSCAFGGEGLRDLYVTSATAKAPPGDALAGSLFVIPDAGQGLPPLPFPA